MCPIVKYGLLLDTSSVQSLPWTPPDCRTTGEKYPQTIIPLTLCARGFGLFSSSGTCNVTQS